MLSFPSTMVLWPSFLLHIWCLVSFKNEKNVPDLLSPILDFEAIGHLKMGLLKIIRRNLDFESSMGAIQLQLFIMKLTGLWNPYKIEKKEDKTWLWLKNKLYLLNTCVWNYFMYFLFTSEIVFFPPFNDVKVCVHTLHMYISPKKMWIKISSLF